MLKTDGSLTAKMCVEVLDSNMSTEKKTERLAYIALRDDCGFNELIPIEDPVRPKEMFDFDILTTSDKRKFLENSPEFFRSGIGGRYLHGINYAKETTRRNFQWLMEMLEIFKVRGDMAAIQKVNERIAKFDISAVFNPAEEMAWAE